MAVEIPVVVDIEGAFREAADKVPTAIKPLQDSIGGETLIPQLKGSLKQLENARNLARKLREELGGVYAQMAKETSMPFATHELEKAVESLGRAEGIANRINFHNQVTDISQANIQLEQMSAHYSTLEKSSLRMSDSINKYRMRLSELNAEWNGLTSKERNSARGVKIYEEAKRVTAALRDEAIGLEQMIQKEEESARVAKRAAEERAAAVAKEQARIESLRRKGASSLQYENAIMNATTKTMRVLQEQEKILSKRLGQATVGSEKYERLKNQLQAVRMEMEKINRDINGGLNPALEKTNSRIGVLIKNSLRLVALHAGTRFIKNVREVTSEFELQKVALGSIIQDTERAEGLFRQIKAAAIESPFEIKDLVSYTKQLSAYRIETDKLFDVTQRLADVSAGLGVDMGRLILAYGQVRAASVLRGQELRQFTEAGIPLVELLAEKFTELNKRTVTTAEVFDLISKRAVPFRMIEDIFNDMTSAGGMFYRMQEKQAETLLGQWNNLKDAVSIMYDEIGRTETVHNAMTGLIKDARWLMQHWRDMARIIKVAGGALLTYVGVAKLHSLWIKITTSAEIAATAAETAREASIKRVTARIIGKSNAEKIATKATIIHTAAIKAANSAATLFGKTMWRLIAILANNPFGVAAIAVISLAGAFTTLANKSKSVEESLNDADKAINSLGRARSNDELIKQYETLSNKTSRSAKETAALRDVSKELGKAFPLATKAIDQQTGALILNIDEMKNYSDQAQKTIKGLMEAQITANEAQIKKYEKQQKHIEEVLGRGYGFVQGSYYFGLSKDAKNAAELQKQLLAAQDGTRQLTQANQDLRDAIDGVQKESTDTKEPYPPISGDDKLNKLRQQISSVTEAYKKFIELRKYLSKESSLENIATFFPSLAGWEPTYDATIQKLEDMLNQYKGNAEATQIIEQAIANIKFDKVKKDLENQLARLTEEMKRSEAARDFYQNILGLTGDEELAANLSMSVYGQSGMDFKDRVQRELYEALNSIDKSQIEDSTLQQLLGDVATLDWDDLEDNIDQVPEAVQKVIRQLRGDTEKYEAEQAESYAKLLLKYNEMEQQRVDISNKAAQDIKTINDGLALELAAIAKKSVSEEEKARQEEQAKARAKSAEDAVNREAGLNLSRLERDYRMFFSSVGVISDESARKVARNQKKMLTEQFEKGEISLAKFKRELREVDEQMKKYETSRSLFGSYLSGGIDGLTGKFNEYADSLRAISHNIGVKGGTSGILALDEETMSYIDKMGMILGGKAFGVEGVSGRSNVAEQLVAAVAKISKDSDEFKANLQSAMDYAAEGADSFASSFAAGMSTAGFWVQNVSTLIKELDVFNQDALKTPKWLDALASTVTWTLGVGGDQAWDRLASLNEYATSGFEKFSQGNFVGAIADNIRGLIEFWGPNIKKINREIKAQDEVIEDLDYQYNRLENSIQKAFGSDYIADYNKQLDALYAKQEAYMNQANLESQKGKKADPAKVKEYEDAARDVGDQILDMQGQLAEFFSGTDLTSSAKDFANAWIEAYKEFGSTTDAMREKFNDMLQNMVENSLAAKIMQEILAPLFQQIDDMAADSELSGADIAQIAASAPEYIDKINAAMSSLMAGLTAAGYNIRQQPGQFTGIKRNIANATEESINGLTQATNVSNFYMAGIYNNVASILAVMTGGTTEQSNSGTQALFNNELALQYMSALPNIDQNIAELLRSVKSVISDKNSSTNLNVIAVRA